MTIPVVLNNNSVVTLDDFAVLKELEAQAAQTSGESSPSLFTMPASNPHGIELDQHGFPLPASLKAWHAVHNPPKEAE